MPASHALLFVLLATVSPPPTVLQVLETRPADSLFAPLARLEAARHDPTAAEATLTLGRLHYARGEYRQAAEAFARAAPRAGALRRGEAHYWAGLAWLGAGEVGQARAAFEEATRDDPGPRPEAQLGVALCWDAEGRPDRALVILQALLAADPGEAGPSALEEVARLAIRLERPELGRRARERLAKDYPRSMEAVRAVSAPAPGGARAPHHASPAPTPAATRVAPPPVAAQVPLTVQIGVFRDEGRARGLAERARHDGFGPARVAVSRDGGGRLFTVRVGIYATAEDARGAGDRMGRALGVAWRLVPAP